jgi:hypothetical protein
MTKPTTTFQTWKRGKLHGVKALAKAPPQPANPSMISQLSKQRKPISLAKVWK